jgi:glycosyltransferase involved in cell wall biosynthesis
MNERPLVSVVMPVRNGARFIRAALDSIIAQQYTPLDIVVVDGHSSDDSAAIARAYPGVRVLHQPDHGLAGGLNHGVISAAGEYIAFLSSDDEWLPGKLHAQMGLFTANAHIDMTITHVQFFIEDGCDIPRGFKPDLLHAPQIGRIPETLMTRRAVFDRIGLFDATFSQSVDADWFARAKDADVTMAVLHDVYLRKRIHDSNLSSNVEKNNRELLTIMQRSVVRQRRSKDEHADSRS